MNHENESGMFSGIEIIFDEKWNFKFFSNFSLNPRLVSGTLYLVEILLKGASVVFEESVF